MEYIKVLLAQRHVELEKILMNQAALPITERASINTHLKHTNKALDDRVKKSDSQYPTRQSSKPWKTTKPNLNPKKITVSSKRRKSCWQKG